MLHRILASSALALSLAACAAQTAPPQVVTAPAVAVPAARPDAPAPLADLVRAVDIPYESFTLDNGLTVLVHTDRKAPVVATSIWYGVGSKHEPKGKTGFAHLFEHLMFNGSENAPGDFFGPLQEMGATDFNGTTWFDRTNYFQTVPTGALDRILMLESDRMGHLLGAVTQAKLDNQRGVVQNEKRQGDNQPYGMVEYEQQENLYPSGHPYRHSTIGSMADLNSATLTDVKGWFRDNYAPNNAVLVLAGDVDLATARDKVTKWFGAFPRGPAVKAVAAPVPTLAAPLAKTIRDTVATTRIYRMWAVPGLNNPDHLPLEIAASVLGGLASSRLDDALVRNQQLAVAVVASADIFAQAGQFIAYADVKPGVDPAKVGSALDAEIARLVAEGPTADELLRAATVRAAGEVRGLEKVGGFTGKAPTLAEGKLYSGDPEFYKKTLAATAAMTPADVRAAAQKWLTRPAFALTIEPGTRSEGGENRGGYIVAPDGGSGARPAYWRNPAFATAQGAAAIADAARGTLPALGELKPLDFPAIERGRLANGIPVYLARRTSVPLVSVRVSFDAGYAADPKDALGTQSLLLRLMGEGTQTMDSAELARAQERLGAVFGEGATADATNFGLSVPQVNLAPTLRLLADVIRRPALAPAELDRVRAQQLADLRAETADPNGLARRALLPLLYGKAHPYGTPPSGLGDRAVVSRLTRDDLTRFHERWLRPDTAAIYIVGDTTLAAAMPLLEASFGDWPAPAAARPTKDFSVAPPAGPTRIVLIDRPKSPQSVILAGEVLDAKGTDDLLDLKSANDILGGNFLSRLNMNLRETKGWSYGVRSGVQDPLASASFLFAAPVQADRTGEAIAEFRREIAAFVGAKGVTPTELQWSTLGSALQLPGSFETNGSVLEALNKTIAYNRPDDYYQTLAGRYRAMTVSGLDSATRRLLRPDRMVYVVVGDRTVVEPQLRKLGLPLEIAAAGDTGG